MKTRDPSQRQLNKMMRLSRKTRSDVTSLTSANCPAARNYRRTSTPRPPLLKGSPSLHAWPLVETQIHLMIKHVWRGGLIFRNNYLSNTHMKRNNFVQLWPFWNQERYLGKSEFDCQTLQVSPGTIGTATGTGTTGTTIIPAPEAMSSVCYLISDRGLDSPN